MVAALKEWMWNSVPMASPTIAWSVMRPRRHAFHIARAHAALPASVAE